ncbi:hypothetical protein HMPREF1982_02677 [Clostridiales bacterium oral taxon 876 str. F0540]|nr:hypothetical protein HMPREF1982_02677 [Clostridiales bacterium oral taxon 876 str. F0540]
MLKYRGKSFEVINQEFKSGYFKGMVCYLKGCKHICIDKDLSPKEKSKILHRLLKTDKKIGWIGY